MLDACFLADSPALRAVAAYEQAVASADEDALHRAMAEMDAQDAWNYESRVKQILTQLKIKDFDQPTGQLSGGQVKPGRSGQCADRRTRPADPRRTDEPPRP